MTGLFAVCYGYTNTTTKERTMNPYTMDRGLINWLEGREDSEPVEVDEDYEYESYAGK